MSKRVNQYLQLIGDLEQVRRPWAPLFQSLDENFLQRKSDFTNASAPGLFLYDDTYNGIPGALALKCASAFASLLWPDAARTFQLVPVAQLANDPEAVEFFQKITPIAHGMMDRVDAGLNTAIPEALLELVVFGTGGIGVTETYEDGEPPVVFESWDLAPLLVSENRNGQIDTCVVRRKQTVRQVYETYNTGRMGDKVAQAIIEAYTEGKKEDTVQTAIVIRPRAPKEGKRGVLAMPIESVHIDITNKTIMRESGYHEFPGAVSRLWKRAGETYGRSYAMTALPTAINMNSLSEAVIRATEKALSPPLVVMDDGRLGGTILDTSANAVNVFNATGMPTGDSPVKQMFTVGEISTAEKLLARFEEELTRAFQLDTLFDLGGDRPMMTAYEASVRNRMRGESSGAVFVRQIGELLIPVIHRTINILFRQGYFGENVLSQPGPKGNRWRGEWAQIAAQNDIRVPDSVNKALAAGLRPFMIHFISPAARFMHAEKLQGLMSVADGLLAVGAVVPDVLYTQDWVKWAQELHKYTGAPAVSLRGDKEVLKAMSEAAAQQQEREAVDAAKTLSQAQASSAQARAALGTKP